MAAQKSMKALVKENKERSYTYKDVPEPVPGPGDLLVRPTKVGLCGSDIHFYDWTSGEWKTATVRIRNVAHSLLRAIRIRTQNPESWS